MAAILLCQQNSGIKQIKRNIEGRFSVKTSCETQALSYSLSRWARGSVVACCALQHKTPTASYLSACLFAWGVSCADRTLGPGFPVGPLAPRPPRGPCAETQAVRRQTATHTASNDLLVSMKEEKNQPTVGPLCPLGPGLPAVPCEMINDKGQKVWKLPVKRAILSVHKESNKPHQKNMLNFQCSVSHGLPDSYSMLICLWKPLSSFPPKC